MYRSIYDFYIYMYHIYIVLYLVHASEVEPFPELWPGDSDLPFQDDMFFRENHRYKTVEMGESIGNISYIYISYILLGDHKIGISY